VSRLRNQTFFELLAKQWFLIWSQHWRGLVFVSALDWKHLPVFVVYIFSRHSRSLFVVFLSHPESSERTLTAESPLTQAVDEKNPSPL
jgi:hypothetical protein